MNNRSFTPEEIVLLKSHGFDVKNNLQDAYKTYDGQTVHISLVQFQQFLITPVHQTARGETGGVWESIPQLLHDLQRET